MKLGKGLVAVAAAMVVTFGTAQAQAAAPAPGGGGATAQQVRELMETMGTKRLMVQMMDQMTSIIARGFPCVPQDKLEATFGGSQGIDELMNQVIPVYQQHFTTADVQGLEKFYRSPLGQKVLQQMPLIMRQSMQIGQKWGQEHARAMVALLTHQGVLDAEGKCPAPKQSVVPAPSSK
ncbi:MAG TPA: DUF2059 domain-containing protein [Rhodanobacteraceae bacterium]|nr:DUF2059 domain-containing protein [Rhodanobacteraceae bacterium]